MSGYKSNSKTVFFRRIRGQPFGVFTWSRNYNRTGGVVFRIGSLGHVQLQHYRFKLVGKRVDGRRGRHGITVSKWGVRGRRRKKSFGFFVDL